MSRFDTRSLLVKFCKWLLRVMLVLRVTSLQGLTTKKPERLRERKSYDWRRGNFSSIYDGS